MWYLEDRAEVPAKYRLPAEFSSKLEKAAIVFGVEEEEIVVQALREFFEKHGIRCSSPQLDSQE